MTKACVVCLEEKDVSEFYRSCDSETGRSLGRTARCKSCISDTTMRIRRRIRVLLRWYKAEMGCLECGEQRPECLDFHHRDPSSKRGCVSTMAWEGKGLNTVFAEMRKCDLLCPNCHRKGHAE